MSLIAFKELNSEFLFQLLDLMAQCGLGDMNNLCSSPEV
jgi:hypothetical protein